TYGRAPSREIGSYKNTTTTGVLCFKSADIICVQRLSRNQPNAGGLRRWLATAPIGNGRQRLWRAIHRRRLCLGNRCVQRRRVVEVEQVFEVVGVFVSVAERQRRATRGKKSSLDQGQQ